MNFKIAELHKFYPQERVLNYKIGETIIKSNLDVAKEASYAQPYDSFF